MDHDANAQPAEGTGRVELPCIKKEPKVFSPSVRLVSGSVAVVLEDDTKAGNGTVGDELDVVEGVGVVGDGPSVSTTRRVPITENVTMLVHDVDGQDPHRVSGIGHPDDYSDNITDNC